MSTENIGHSDLDLCVCLGQVHMHICIKYEGSMQCTKCPVDMAIWNLLVQTKIT